jgi:hypothetical protein
MELSSTREPTSCASTHELSSIFMNPKVPYRIYKSPPQISNLSQINPVLNTSSYLSKINLNVIHPPRWVPFFLALPSISYMHFFHATCTAHFILLELIILIILSEENTVKYYCLIRNQLFTCIYYTFFFTTCLVSTTEELLDRKVAAPV